MILSRSRLEILSKWPHLASYWHFISATVLTVNNYPEEIPILYEYFIKDTAENQQKKRTLQIQEAIFKSSGLCGLPRVINSLTSLKSVIPEHLKQREMIRDSERNYQTDGSQLFSKVYGKVTQRVLGNMRMAYPDLPYYATNCLYGPLFSPTEGLEAKETCMVIVAALVPQNVKPQLKGHLKGALNCGATQEEVESVCELTKLITHWCEDGKNNKSNEEITI
ncbi:Pxp2 protein [Starmerella bacillaris]|uniref:Pxp2 protein n=1 Tax=Starmerella bacillaris TaxID=1247836 RepID=A0AAV5RJI6_STABA|nr:Pxp2 protein [Starmerella bacillaris]